MCAISSLKSSRSLSDLLMSSCVRGHFYEIGIAALLFRVKSRHVEKFRKFRFAHVGKSELGKKERKRNMRKT